MVETDGALSANTRTGAGVLANVCDQRCLSLTALAAVYSSNSADGIAIVFSGLITNG